MRRFPDWQNRRLAVLMVVLLLLGAYSLVAGDTSKGMDHEVNTDANPAELLYSSTEHLQYTDYRYVHTRTTANTTDCKDADIVVERGWMENSNQRVRHTVTIESYYLDSYATETIRYEKTDPQSSWTPRISGEFNQWENLFTRGNEELLDANVTVVARTEDTIALRIDRTNETTYWFANTFHVYPEPDHETRVFYLDADTGRIQRVERTLYGGYYGDYCQVITVHDYGSATADRPEDLGFHVEEVIAEIVHRIGLD